MPPAPLLALLPAEERDRLQSLMRRVPLENAQTLAWPNAPIESVHFPIDAVVSAVAHGEGGESVEAGLIGCEGVAGLPLFLRQRTSSLQLQCQVPGEAWRMRAEDFVRESAAPGPLQHALFGYAHGFLAMTAQGVLCNGQHAVDERCARWLLMTHDRVGRDTFPLTHEFIAVMLAAGRPGVSIALGSLQRAGAIAYHRGQMTITDRAALEAASCPCYAITVTQFAKLDAAPPAGTTSGQ